MFLIIAHLSGALGIFFMGTRLLTEHLKTLNDRRLRRSFTRWTRNRWLGFAWGLCSGSVMQSTTVLTLVVVSMLKSGLVSSRRALPVLLGGNVGVTMLVLVVVLDVKLMAFFILGIAYGLTLLMTRPATARYRAMASASFGLGMIILGSIMLKESVAPLTTHAWFQETITWLDGSLLLPLLSGMLLTFVVQSMVPVVMAGIGMATGGLLEIDQALTLYCGACLGSSLILYVLTTGIAGGGRQVAMYQIFFNCLLNAIFLPLICIETYGDIPLISAALGASGLPLDQGLALCMICIECSTALFRLATLDVEIRLIERWWPPSEVEVLAKPQFIHDEALDDHHTALLLLDLEQRRLLEVFSRYLDTLRRGTGLGELRESAGEIMRRLGEFLDDLASTCRGHEAEALRSMTMRQKTLIRLDQEVYELCDALHRMPRKPLLDVWSLGFVEGIDVLVIVLSETLASGDASAWPSTTQLMGDRSAPLRRLRHICLNEGAALTAEERKHVLKLANSSQHVFLLVSQLAHDYRQASGIDEAFLDNAGLQEPVGVSAAFPEADPFVKVG